MQLDMRLGAPREDAREGIEEYLGEAVQRELVHLVERQVHYFCKKPFNHDTTAGDGTHQATDGTKFAERDQRAEIPVLERLQRLAAQMAWQHFAEMSRLLVRGLRARWHGRRFAWPRAAGAVAKGKNIRGARCFSDTCVYQTAFLVAVAPPP